MSRKAGPHYRDAADHRRREGGISTLSAGYLQVRADNSCIGCPKKLMELVDSELCYWQYQIQRGIPPTFDELYSFGKMCRNIRRALVKNGRILA